MLLISHILKIPTIPDFLYTSHHILDTIKVVNVEYWILSTSTISSKYVDIKIVTALGGFNEKACYILIVICNDIGIVDLLYI